MGGGEEGVRGLRPHILPETACLHPQVTLHIPLYTRIYNAHTCTIGKYLETPHWDSVMRFGDGGTR